MPNLSRRAIRAVLCAGLLLGAWDAGAQAPETPPQRLDGARISLDQIESGLKRGDLSDADLQRLRGQMDPVSADVQTALDELAPQYDAVKTRLDQLGPKPAEKAPPESESAAAARAGEEARLKPIDDLIRRARLLGVEIEQTGAMIGNRRRALFARALFEQSSSLLSPALWLEVARELPADLRAITIIVGDWSGALLNTLAGWKLLLLAGALALIGAFYPPVARMARRVLVNARPDSVPTDLQRVMGAFASIILRAILPIAILVILGATLDSFGVLAGRLHPVFRALMEAVARIALCTALAYALAAPARPDWRFLPVSGTAAERIVNAVFAFTAVISASKILEAVNDAIGAGLPLTVAARGCGALAAALVLIVALRCAGGTLEDKAAAAQALPLSARQGWLGPVRLALWGGAFIVIGAVLAGYAALGSFVTDQIVWIGAVSAVVFLLSRLVNEGAGAAFKPQASVGRTLISGFGLRREALDQIGVILAGAVQVAVFVIAATLLVAPLGIESQDMFGYVRAAFFGFKVGDVTISLASIVVAILLFALGVLITRALQRWLEVKFLPHTRLDTGLRNSIKTSLGYLGFVLAASLALSHLGLSFEKLAIVAGALSVGIGFGLQSIVNNFVSGLILLWERAIRVGDWIVVGDEQGFVRRINVRSTEIETFDRAAVIVPNSNLVSGIVKNWVRMDRIGRIKIDLGVSYDADPEVVHDLLIDCAKAHAQVLAIPSPAVLFTSFGDSALQFELICFVEDVETGGRVKSDLHFDIIKHLRAAGISIPFPQRDMNLRGLDKIEAALARNLKTD